MSAAHEAQPTDPRLCACAGTATLLLMNPVVSVGAILVIALDQVSDALKRAITRIAPTGIFFTGT